jgi:ferrous iron transport protein A
MAITAGRRYGVQLVRVRQLQNLRRITTISETQFQFEARLAMHDVVPLQMLPLGRPGRIDQLLGRPDEVHRLEELGMRVGAAVELLRGGSPCIVNLAGTRLAFRDNEALRVLVRLGEPA